MFKCPHLACSPLQWWCGPVLFFLFPVRAVTHAMERLWQFGDDTWATRPAEVVSCCVTDTGAALIYEPWGPQGKSHTSGHFFSRLANNEWVASTTPTCITALIPKHSPLSNTLLQCNKVRSRYSSLAVLTWERHSLDFETYCICAMLQAWWVALMWDCWERGTNALPAMQSFVDDSVGEMLQTSAVVHVQLICQLLYIIGFSVIFFCQVKQHI